ncbi:uncharacterized protein F4822DRAFT_100890 [Hypoxylon trugodes]|uniref:uncharacterized protein n=1 Tax=Hypoxylon trugodes TaxID=326681 RepID=UPI002193220D|nr:uncharacterized protein F4822DRAFT_100890 [Hypoxylon trugodes]KAI1382616.1 hypothetical protein F4822DRAFT_100890 [Hypoxylon trugodes]
MLPAAVPDARIYTYDWDAKVFDNAPVQTLLSHADNLLSLIAVEHSTSGRSIIFIASCFGGLVLAEAICRAAQEGSKYRQILQSTIGIVFLATPFSGTDAARPASWLVVIKGIMGKEASGQLIKDLEERHAFVRERVQKFAEIANDNAIRLPIWCFFETKKTKIAKKILPTRILDTLSHGSILVTESSACLHGFHRRGLGKAHVMMNKFEGKDCPDFIQVKEAIQSILEEAPNTLKRRVKDTKETHFMVPFGRNENFVGRESILQQLLSRIPPSTIQDDCQRTALEGLGGIGKTQIALEAAYRVRHKHPDCSVFWVPAVDATSFENAYRDIGRQLGVKGIEDDKADVKMLVRVALSHESAGSWLLVIDNADDLKLFADATLSDYLPFNRNGSILFTTRNHEAAVRLDIPQQDIMNVTKMNNDEATNLLRAGLKEDQIRDAESITHLLGFLANLPLAIKQASAYMAKTGMLTSKYLQHCQSSDKTMVKLLSQDFEDRNRYKNINNPIATTWLISFNHISRDYPLATRYLRFICYLAEKDVPTSLLPPGEDELESDEAIGILKGYAFVIERKEPDSFDIHRLVRLAMRNWLQTNGEWQKWAIDAIQHLTDKYPFPMHENRSIWMRYLPHGQLVLYLRNKFADKKTDLLFNIAGSYSMLGKYNEAEQMYRQTLELRERMLGREHPSTLASMNNLALVLDSQGKYKEAEQMHRQTLELRERILGREHPDTLGSMNNLAGVLRNQGKYEETKQIHRQTLELTERILGREHPDTLDSMNNLALVLDSQGKYEEAEQIHRQTLELRERMLGREHPDTLDSMNNLALVLDSQGKYEETKQIHRQTLELREQILGREHPDTLVSMNNLALVLNSQGKYKEAEQMHRQTLELMERVLGKEHPSTLGSMNNLAGVLRNQGKYEEAEQIHRQTLELRKRILGKEHPDTFANMNNLAGVFQDQGKYEEAEQIHRQTLELRKRILGKEHPDTFANMNNLAGVFQDQGKYEEAEQIYRQTLELTERILGREHPDILGSMNNLAIILNNQGKYKEAEQIYRQTLELRKRILGREHPDTLASMNNLAVVLNNQGKYKEAEQIHYQTLELKERILGREHPDTLASMNNLARVVQNQGKYKEAEQIYRQTLELMERILGREHPDIFSSMNNLAGVFQDQGKCEEAEQIYRQTLELRKRILGKEHPDTLASMNNLAVILNNQRKYKETEQIHRQTLELKERMLGREHPSTFASMNNLAIILNNQGKYKEAEQIYRQTLELMELILGRKHPDILASMNNLANVLDSQGKYKEAEQIHRQTLELRERILGREHPDILGSMNNLARVLQNQGKYEEAEQIHRQTLELRERMLGKEHPSTLRSKANLDACLQAKIGKGL